MEILAGPDYGTIMMFGDNTSELFVTEGHTIHQMWGHRGNDTFDLRADGVGDAYGGRGRDTFYSSGNDVMHGQRGADTFVFTPEAFARGMSYIYGIDDNDIIKIVGDIGNARVTKHGIFADAGQVNFVHTKGHPHIDLGL